VENAANGIHLTSEPSQYAGQVTSPILNVSPNSCYVFTPSITLHKGGIDVEVVDPDNKKLLRTEFVFTVTGNDQYQPHIRIKTADDSHLQLVFTDANPHQAEVTDFILTNVAMSPCP
jgi:hypothetical protein